MTTAITATQDKAVIKSAAIEVLCESYETISDMKPRTVEEVSAKGTMLCAIKAELFQRDRGAWMAWTNSNMPGYPSKFFSA